jgi:hypothetical protein
LGCLALITLACTVLRGICALLSTPLRRNTVR